MTPPPSSGETDEVEVRREQRCGAAGVDAQAVAAVLVGHKQNNLFGRRGGRLPLELVPPTEAAAVVAEAVGLAAMWPSSMSSRRSAGLPPAIASALSLLGSRST